MENTTLIMPSYLAFRQRTPGTSSPICLHHRSTPPWKRLLHSRASSVLDDELALTQNLAADTQAAGMHLPPVAITFVDGENFDRSVSELVESIVNPNSTGVSAVVVSRSEVNSIVQALKAFLQERNGVKRTLSDHKRASTAPPALDDREVYHEQ